MPVGMPTPRELRRQVVDGEAPVLIDGAAARAILDISPGQLARMVREGLFEDCTMTGERSFYRARDVRRIMLGTLRHERKSERYGSMTCKPVISRSRVASEGNASAATASPEPSRAPTNRNLATELAPIVAEIRADGAVSLQAVADTLNARGFKTALGGRWDSTKVRKTFGVTALTRLLPSNTASGQSARCWTHSD
jgi:hypothetical protein